MRDGPQILVAIVIVGSVFALTGLLSDGGGPVLSSSGHAERQERPAAQPSPRHDTRQVAAPAALPNPAEPPGTTADRPTTLTSTSEAATGEGADLDAGRQVYRKCQACHSLEPGKNRLGPSLAGVVGRKAGTLSGYRYSSALTDSGLTWNAATLDAYLQDPQKLVPGNKMPFPGIKTENQRREVIAYLAAATGGVPKPPTPPPTTASDRAPATSLSVKYIPDVRYTLRTVTADGRTTYHGVGGEIEGIANPRLSAVEGQVVQVTLINGDGSEHDVVFPDQATRSPRVVAVGAGTSVAFRAGTAGSFAYFDSVPGQREAGMQGVLVVSPRPPPESIVQADISRDPADVPPPVGSRLPNTVRLDLVTLEQEGRLADGTTYTFWTFNGRVPGPFVRVRVGDAIEVHVKNSDDSSMIHSVDFHAATGPGGGAASLQVDPGQEKSIRWRALIPGLYVYHCATPMVAHHIASGMYGLILVEPEGGLPAVDREFYVMQGEVYTEAAYGQRGSQEFSVERLLDEDPEYFIFNGSVGAISSLHPLHAKVGETVRIYFGVGGPNFTSSFHVIGEIFDKVYSLGGVLTQPVEGVQTVNVPAGGAVIAEFKLDVPGNYILVDHALSRAERGLVGILVAEGEPNKEIYDGIVTPGSGH